jgi:flagellar hook-length control protein FliK
MDILNLAQGMLNGSGLPMQAEPIAGPKAVETPAQTPAAFNDALLNVINSLMIGQTKTTRDSTVSAVPLPQSSDDDDDETADAPTPGDSLLKADAPQQLLEALLMTSQMPVQPPSGYLAKAQPAADTMMPNLQPQLAAQVLPMGISPLLSQSHQATPVSPVDPAASPLPAVQSVAPTLMAAMAPVAQTTLITPQPGSDIAAAPTSSPSPVPTTTLKMDPEPGRWGEQLQRALGERLQVQVKQQIQHATIRLDPPDMGKIDISMQVDNGRVQVQINASHAEVYRALQQTSNDLRQSLTEQHFVQVNVQVSSQSGGQQQGRGQSFTGEHNAILAGAEIAANTADSPELRRDDSVLLTV